MEVLKHKEMQEFMYETREEFEAHATVMTKEGWRCKSNMPALRKDSCSIVKSYVWIGAYEKVHQNNKSSIPTKEGYDNGF